MTCESTLRRRRSESRADELTLVPISDSWMALTNKISRNFSFFFLNINLSVTGMGASLSKAVLNETDISIAILQL